MQYVYFLEIIFILLIVLTSRNGNRGVSPIFIFYLVWGISFSLYLVGTYFESVDKLYVLVGIDKISDRTIIFLVTANLLIFLGYKLLFYLRIVSKSCVSCGKVFKTNSLYSYVIYLAILFFLIELILNFHSYVSLSTLYELRTQEKEDGSIFSLITSYLSIFVLPVSIWQISIGQKKILNWIPILIVGILAIVNLSKYLLLFIFIYWISNIVLGNRFLYVNRFKIKSTLLRGVIPVVILTSIITIIRPSSKDDNSDKVAFIPILFTYTSGYIPSFGNYYDEYILKSISPTMPSYEYYDKVKDRFGNQTFAGFYRLLQQFKIVRYGATVHYEGFFNVYTVYRDLITDFGICLTYFICFLFGMFVNLFDKLLNRNNPAHLIYISMIATILVFTLTYSLFGFTFVFLMFFSPYFFIKESNEL